MKKLIIQTILEDNKLTIHFDNDSYIQVNNLDSFTVNIVQCAKELHYLEFPFMSEENDEYIDEYENPYNDSHRALICSNGTAILLEIKMHEFGDYYAERFDSINKFLKENFIIYNVEEDIDDQELVKSELKYYFEQIRQELQMQELYEKKKRELDEEEEKRHKKYIFYAQNYELLYNNIKNEVSIDEFNMILAFIDYNYDFLINSQNLKASQKLRQVIRVYYFNHIVNLLLSKNFDMSIYSFLLQNFKPKFKSKKILLQFEAKQIGAEHDKSWEISNLSFLTI